MWTTTRTPEVVAFLEPRGYDEVRRYVLSELDVAAAPEPEPPAFEVVTFADRPELEHALFELALEAYPDQPGRAETRIDEAWFEWGLRSQPPELDPGRARGRRARSGTSRRRSSPLPAAPVGAASPERSSVRRSRGRRRTGVETLRVANEVRLAGMLALNRRLGFVPLYDEIVLRGPIPPC